MNLSQPCPMLVPSWFWTWKLLCLLGLFCVVPPFLLIFAHKLLIYSIIVDKGLICFVPKCGWDSGLVKCSLCFAVNGFKDNHEIHEMKTRNARNRC